MSSSNPPESIASEKRGTLSSEPEEKTSSGPEEITSSESKTPTSEPASLNVGQNISQLAESISSPLILPISILLYSAFQTSTSGIPYMVFLIIFIFVRSKLFKVKDSDKCINNIPFLGKSKNADVFISIFSLSYVLLPMIILKSYNIASIIIIIPYTLTNLVLSWYKQCYKDPSFLIGDVFFSIVSGVVSILIIIAYNSSLNVTDKNFLFIDSSGSSQEICSMPTKQNFKCNVYQNGQLVTQTQNVPN